MRPAPQLNYHSNCYGLLLPVKACSACHFLLKPVEAYYCLFGLQKNTHS